ncbi:MAG: DNA starvation/stationary phase protection protein [Propionibacteriales bacterium]|nr:DNA starvation/stationary phase protection protein [Propionibacteriales bacterium]
MATKARTPKTTSAGRTGTYTVPGLTIKDGHHVAEILQKRLNALNDLALTLKHVHWNVVGPHFIAVHQMIDPHVTEVRAMVDETAERIATLGVSPVGTPGALVKQRPWDDYSLGRATTNEHLGALDEVYENVIASHRKAQEEVADIDAITEDLLIGHLHQLELFHWFVRAHLENAAGDLSTEGAKTETAAAGKAKRAAKKQ